MCKLTAIDLRSIQHASPTRGLYTAAVTSVSTVNSVKWRWREQEGLGNDICRNGRYVARTLWPNAVCMRDTGQVYSIIRRSANYWMMRRFIKLRFYIQYRIPDANVDQDQDRGPRDSTIGRDLLRT